MVVAAVVAHLLWFAGGRRYGYRVLKLLCRMSLSPDTCVRQTEGIFDRGMTLETLAERWDAVMAGAAPAIVGHGEMDAAAWG